MNDFERMERNLEREYTKKEEARLAKKINTELDYNRPKDQDFAGVYPNSQISADNAEVEQYLSRKDPNHGNQDALRDGLELEGVFSQIDAVELFEETSDDERYNYLFTEDNDFAMQSFPAHKHDDTFNNTDMYCTLCNTDTDHHPIVFSIDCTTNSSKVGAKMGYRRGPQKLQGTTCARYFKDMQQNDPDVQNFPTGQIDVMPRFVIGCDKEDSSELVKFLYDFKDAEDPDKYDKKHSPCAYEHALGHVRSCVIMELCDQTKANLASLEQQAAVNPTPELSEAINIYSRLDKYFSNTLIYLTRTGKIHGDYKFDSVYGSVRNECQDHA